MNDPTMHGFVLGFGCDVMLWVLSSSGPPQRGDCEVLDWPATTVVDRWRPSFQVFVLWVKMVYGVYARV